MHQGVSRNSLGHRNSCYDLRGNDILKLQMPALHPMVKNRGGSQHQNYGTQYLTLLELFSLLTFSKILLENWICQVLHDHKVISCNH